jgi:BON domain-containing protein
MQGKYDRNVEDLDRTRMEEGRFWGARQTEPGSFQFGAGFPSYGQDPTWFYQQQRYQQPIPQSWNPYGPYQYGLNPGIPQPYSNPMHQQFLQQPGLAQNIPYGYQNIHGQPGFQQLGLVPLGVFPQSLPHSQWYLTQQQYPFQPVPIQTPLTGYTQMEGAGIEFPERQAFSQRGIGRPGTRIFHRPPRNYRRSDELIRDEICKRLAFTPEVDATDVDVIVKDGEVTLRGNVDDRFEKRLVEDIIENTFGVRDLLNELRIGTRLSEQEFTGPSTKGKEK